LETNDGRQSIDRMVDHAVGVFMTSKDDDDDIGDAYSAVYWWL